MNFLLNFSRKTLKLWDPFCGSGTILLETLSNFLGLPVRTNVDSEIFNLSNIRAISKENHEKFLENLNKIQNNPFLEESEILLLGNDIDKEATKSSMINFSNLLKDHQFDEKFNKPPENSHPITENPVLFHHSFLGKRIHIFLTDFENIPTITSLKGFTIITNPPYGYRSRSHINFTNLKSSYARFKTLLRKNLKNLDEVYVLYPIDKRNSGSLIKIPGLAWNLLEKFENGGIEVGLFQLDKELTHSMRRKDENEITIVNERMLKEREETEKHRELIAFKQSPEEKEKRRQEKFKEEKHFLVEAKKVTKDLKFPRVVTKDRQKLRNILHDKHQEFIKRGIYKKFVQGRENREEKMKEIKAKKSHNYRKKKGLAVLDSLIDKDAQPKEDLKESLQLELNKKAKKNMKELLEGEKKRNSTKKNKW